MNGTSKAKEEFEANGFVKGQGLLDIREALATFNEHIKKTRKETRMSAITMNVMGHQKAIATLPQRVTKPKKRKNEKYKNIHKTHDAWAFSW